MFRLPPLIALALSLVALLVAPTGFGQDVQWVNSRQPQLATGEYVKGNTYTVTIYRRGDGSNGGEQYGSYGSQEAAERAVQEIRKWNARIEGRDWKIARIVVEVGPIIAWSGSGPSAPTPNASADSPPSETPNAPGNSSKHPDAMEPAAQDAWWPSSPNKPVTSTSKSIVSRKSTWESLEKQNAPTSSNNGIVTVGRQPGGSRPDAPGAYVVYEERNGRPILRRLTTNAKEAKLAEEEIGSSGGRAYQKEFSSLDEASVFTAGKFKVITPPETQIVDVGPMIPPSTTSPSPSVEPQAPPPPVTTPQAQPPMAGAPQPWQLDTPQAPPPPVTTPQAQPPPVTTPQAQPPMAGAPQPWQLDTPQAPPPPVTTPQAQPPMAGAPQPWQLDTPQAPPPPVTTQQAQPPVVDAPPHKQYYSSEYIQQHKQYYSSEYIQRHAQPPASPVIGSLRVAGTRWRGDLGESLLLNRNGTFRYDHPRVAGIQQVEEGTLRQSGNRLKLKYHDGGETTEWVIDGGKIRRGKHVMTEY